ncbi:four-carbon acid sugar kinase family protein [Saccharopolyspora aridisoli]|uniref:four-carbon acid sugar kinase family protein n=1 Tax=Saccharopolyspora aridisoli TaxID=2530385 RepID=UPI001A9DD121|nr:four-carbon acid sugar kinase family protein [Saccharopolyspora aridisoli]
MLENGLLVLADDLSGAVETAACLRPLGQSTTVELARQDPAPTAHNAQAVVVMDLDIRALPATEAGRITSVALRGAGDRVFVKIDSQLRGNVGAVLSAAADRPLVVAPALPALRRSVVGGVAHLHGVPLHRSDAWQVEGTSPPRSIAEALTPLPCRTIALETVRSASLRAALAECIATGEVPICDGEMDADLDAVVAAAPDGARLAGSGGLAAALGRTAPEPADETPITPTGNPLLLVVGTASPEAAEQLRIAELRGMRTVACSTTDLVGQGTSESALSRALVALERGPTALRIDPSEPVAPGQSRNLVRGLASTAARIVERQPGPVDIVLTGGETARLVLDALGVRRLVPVGQIHHGAVHSRTPAGTSVVTRPGSFGESDSLARIVEHLRPAGIERLPK